MTSHALNLGNTKQPTSLLPSSFQEEAPQFLKGELLLGEPLARYTSLKIGGPADALFFPESLEALKTALGYCKKQKIPVFILGQGSNLLIRDGGIRGLVIRLNKALNQFELLNDLEDEYCPEEVLLKVQAGVSLPKVIEFCKQKGLSGLESLYGVPGSVGGALFMNAGTREGEIGSSVVDLSTLTSRGEIKISPGSALEFEYRHLKLPVGEVIVEATLQLKRMSSDAVGERVRFFQKRRLDTQPLNQPNVGSIFKNPPKKFAAELIEELGLKGVRFGGARISDKHSNWIVNEGNASAHDVLVLINLIKDKVKEILGVKLELEVKVVGED